MRIALLSLAGLLVGLLVYGSLIEPRLLLDTQEIEAEVPNLPASWENQRVALIADFQTGMWFDNPGMVSKAVDAAIAADVSLALIAGDFMYQPDSAIAREATALVRPLVEAGIPTVAVLGNHDYSLMKKDSEERPPIAEYLAEQLEAAGVEVLENGAVAVASSAGEALWVAGVGSVWAENADVRAASAPLPPAAARLWLMHNPEAYRRIPAGEAPVTLAAHTHGGQVRLPFTPHFSWLDVVRSGETVADGWAADSIGAAGNRLYVNRGIGFSTVPVRIRCRPELTVLTLRSPSSQTASR